MQQPIQKKINLYQLYFPKYDEIVFSLVKKILEQKQRAIIFGENKNLIDSLDNSLWTSGRGSFLPHSKLGELENEKQPVLLIENKSSLLEQTYIFDNLIVLEGLDIPNSYLEKFNNIFIILDRASNSFNDVKQLISKDLSKNYKISPFIQKEDGKWGG